MRGKNVDLGPNDRNGVTFKQFEAFLAEMRGQHILGIDNGIYTNF